MVRLLILITMMVSIHARAQDLYLSSSEKAALSLGLRAVLLKQDDADYLVKNLVVRARALEGQLPRAVQVKSYEEFIKLQKNKDLFGEYKLNQLNVEQLFEVMPDPVYYSRSEKVQRKINLYVHKKLELKKLMATSAMGLSIDFITKSNDVKTEEIQIYVKEKINLYTETFVSKMTEGSDSQYVHVLAKLLKAYFELLPTTQKAEILYRLMQLPLQPSPDVVFLTMIQNTGPQMQKLVQIIGRNPIVPEEFRAIFQKLESQVQPVPWTEVKSLISSEVNLDQFSYFEHDALGVGTMAQTHRMQLKGMPHNGRTYVVRFLKPGMRQMLDMDQQILNTIATDIDNDPEFKKYNLPSLKKQVRDVHESVEEELHLELTVQNQTEGKSIYETQIPISFNGQKNILEVHVPETKLFGKNKTLMQQEIIFGKKVGSEVASYAEAYPDLYKVVALKLTEHWIEQAFFKSGFFHADLHQGNILMKVTDEKVQVNFLDFGMVGKLTQNQRDNMFLLALGFKLNNVKLIAESFSHLTRHPMEWDKKIVFEKDVAERVQKIIAGEEKFTSMEEWAAWALTKGLDLHYEFIKLNRGIMAVSSLLEDSKSPVTFEDAAFNVVLRNKTKVMSLLSKQKFVKYSDIIGLGLETIKANKAVRANKCVNLFL